jgi:hypothetical protein
MLENRAGLSSDEADALARTLAGHVTLQEVVVWGLAQRPPRVAVGVIQQDEYTHDVIIPYGGDRFLVYDTT